MRKPKCSKIEHRENSTVYFVSENMPFNLDDLLKMRSITIGNFTGKEIKGRKRRSTSIAPPLSITPFVALHLKHYHYSHHLSPHPHYHQNYHPYPSSLWLPNPERLQHQLLEQVRQNLEHVQTPLLTWHSLLAFVLWGVNVRFNPFFTRRLFFQSLDGPWLQASPHRPSRVLK